MVSLSKVIKLRFLQNFKFNLLLQFNLLSSSYIYTDNFVKKCYVILEELHFSYYVDRKFCVSSSYVFLKIFLNQTLS